MHVALPPELPVRLSVVAQLTGVPISTLKDAIDAGDIPDALWKQNRWHISLAQYERWIQTGETAERRRDLSNQEVGWLGPVGGPQGDQAADGPVPTHQDESPGRVEPKAPAKRKAKRSRPKLIIYTREGMEKGA
jgi:hypothetical protein